MKTNMAATSLSAYESLKQLGELPLREMQVYLCIAIHGPMTREQIAERIGMKEGSVCGRVNKLMHERKRLIETGIVINQVTGKENGVLDLPMDHRAMFPVQR